MVMKVLCKMENDNGARRYSRQSSHRSNNSGNCDLSYNQHTKAEESFARLMVILSIFFVVCWIPQLVSGIPNFLFDNVKNI